MNQCLKISIEFDALSDQLLKTLQSHAQSLRLEGTVQRAYEPTSLRIYVCGNQTAIQEFIDGIHHAIAHIESKNFIIEPFMRQKDYRGVFRIIE